MNKLDRIKLTKYAKMSNKEKIKQNKYFKNFMQEVLKRKKLGNEKYGNYMLVVDRKTALKELKEEVCDVVAHYIMLMYRTENNKGLK